MTDEKTQTRRLALMRLAKTSANAKHGMGGLPKGKGHKPKPVTLPKMPWNEELDAPVSGAGGKDNG